MDKQKQIEEMQKDIAIRMAMAKGVAGSMNNGVEGWLSEYLYNAGYRKIPEGSVVLTKEELQAHDKGLVDKFAERLKEKAHWFLNNEIQKDHFCECLDEICKEITGEK